MPIPVECECGRAMRVKDEMAGKKGRCPSCNGILLIPAVAAPPPLREVQPAADDEDERPRRRESIRTRPDDEDDDRPRRRPPLRRDADEDDADDRPRRPAARSREEEEEDEDRPRRPRPRPRLARERPSRGGGGFAVSGTVAGGLLAMLIAVVWFVGGLAVGIIFFYPPVLFILGLVGFIRGLAGGE